MYREAQFFPGVKAVSSRKVKQREKKKQREGVITPCLVPSSKFSPLVPKEFKQQLERSFQYLQMKVKIPKEV